MLETVLQNQLIWAYFLVGPIILVYFGVKSWIEYRESSDFAKNIREILGAKPTLQDEVRKYAMYFLAGVIIFVAWPIFIIWVCHKKYKEYLDMLERRKPKFFCLDEFLIREISAVEAEKDSLVIDPLGMAPAVPFGHLNKVWCDFLAGIEEGDSLCLFEIPKGSFTGKENWTKNPMHGYAQVRRKKIIAEFIYKSG
jgi:hypothetical protein